MTVLTIVENSAEQRVVGVSATLEALLKAQSGDIPVAALGKIQLEKNDVALFLARELLFLRSVAEGGKFSTLSILFDELHMSLLDSVNAKVSPE